MNTETDAKKTIWVTGDQHRALKQEAAETGRSVQAITAEVISEGLKYRYAVTPLEAA